MVSVSENEMIGVPLAHRLPDWEAERLGASDVRNYVPGESITLPRSGARMLLAAGLLQCNPRDQDAVDKVLQLPASSGAHAVPAAPAGKPPAGGKPAGDGTAGT